jgi:amino acid adenylation domain-containing protein
MPSSVDPDVDGAFEIPGITPELRARLERLSPEKRQLAIARLLARSGHGQSSQTGAGHGPVPVARGGNLPLSFAQERLWVLHEMDRGDVAYNIPAALVLTGDLRLVALKQALQEIVRRHETLRTTFDVHREEPVQKIGTEPILELPLEDLTHLSEHKLDEARRWAARELEEPFDLRTGPVIRGRILRLDANRHVLLLTVHHIVADGWSMEIIVTELEQLYRMLISEASLPPGELELQYADYAVWQRKAARDGGLEPELRYWAQQLEGAPTVLDLPADHRRPPVRSSRGGTVAFEIGPGLAEDLRVLGQDAEATRYMVLLAAFSTFLYRIGGQDDVVIGSPVAGRTRRELEPLIGFFVNTLPLRCQLTGNPTFQELLSRVKRTVADAYGHQHLPFEKLVERLNPDRNPSHTPIFQVVFGYQESPPPGVSLPRLEVTPLEMDGVTSKHDLTLLMENRGATLTGLLEYSSDLFLAATARRYAECFQQILQSIVEQPDARLDEIQLLTKEDALAISQWSGTSTSYPGDRSIHSLFEAEAQTHPDTVALITDQGSMTYRELNERANRLTHVLRARGVIRGMSVGICLRRSPDLIAGILAILKSGGAYVPLDPDYPSERLQFMLGDAETHVVVTDAATRSIVDKADSDRRLQIVCTDLEGLAESAACVTDPGLPTPADQVAYIMYTSGSTGLPKGAEIPHRAVLRLVRETDFMELSDSEVFLQFAPVSFDASTLEIWGPLLNGGKLVIPPPQALSLDQLGEQIRKHGVTTLWLTSGLFSLMVDDRMNDLRGLRQLLTGGDVLSVAHVQKALAALPDTRLINGYGPTENTTFTCCFTIPREDWTDRSIPIGRPIANTRVVIVDRNLRLVPPGVAGELLVGGDGLFLGYRNQLELNRQKLIHDPFSSRAEARLYRTGDRARYLEDGTIEFIGRLDDQVKIRGFRVEPGEIESVLLQHPDLRESVVVTRQDFGQKELVAYVVRDKDTSHPQSTDAELVEALRVFIDQRLPAHLNPSSVTVLDALPLSPNGKVDRDRLPVPATSAAQTSPSAPENHTEQKLWELWREVLGREAGSTADSFFDVGGNSLLATQVISRIRRHYGLDMPIHDLFRYSTIRDLSARIEQLGSQQTVTSRAEIASIQSESGETTELSFAQERLWFLDRLEPDSPFYNVAFAQRISGPLDIVALERSLNAVVARHDALRTSFVEGDGQAHIRLHDKVEIQLPITNLRDVDDLERELIGKAHEEARTVFDLTKVPLLRSRLLVTGTEEYVLLVTMHHIVSDGWSLGVLVRELVACYRYFTSGAPTGLADLPIQYADFARWQKRWFTGNQATTQLSYWKQQLSGFPTELRLPTDRSRPPSQSFRGSSIRFTVNAETTARLNQLCRRLDATMFMVLLAAFDLLLYRYSEKEDIIVGSPVANRNHDELEPLIGFFVNTLALRTDLSGNPSFEELVGRVRKICLEAFANQDYPFEKVVDELQPERDLSRNPLFQVMFALQNAPEEKLEIPDLSFSVLDAQRTTAQFDIVLDMWETHTGLLGVFEFSTDLFDEPTLRRMAGHLTTLLQGVVGDPSHKLSEFPLLGAAEERQLLVEFAGPRRSYPVERTLHSLFEETAEKYPERTAAVHRDRSIRFDELNAKANQIAWQLRACDLQPSQFVAIVEPRSIDFLASMLGVLKAGGAVLPIDSQYPEDRIRYMLEDSQVNHLITSSALLQEHEFLGRDGGIAHVLRLDEDVIGEGPCENPGQVNTSADLAYVIYTSGSTGQPKGAMIRHNGAVNHIFAEFELLQFDLHTTFLQSAPASSDISIWQFLGPVLKGARTVVADFETVCDAARLFGLIKREGITLIELVPVLLQGLLEHARGLEANDRSLPDLERAMVTGEAVTVPLVNQWLDTYPDIQLVNAYGPTEAADDTSQFIVAAKLPADRRSVPIGKPIPNMNHYVLDAHLHLVPIGVPGEICVAGIGVGDGYWQDEDKTRTHFTANPYVDDDPPSKGDAVLYRTGDRGFWRADGNLEYLERLDTQVKVRGFRIELGEIETLLADHPAVRETAVCVRADEDGDRRLSAYFVADLSSTQTRQELAGLRDEQVQLWKELHENSYQSTPTDFDPTFNTIGWDDNYTGAPLPPEDMKEYVRYTVERVRSLGPGRVLEIGCGTGLILFPLVPHCRSYTGMDLSRVAIDQLQELQARADLQAGTTGLADAVLLQGSAHDLSGFAPASFDTVILPSVVQYFPGIQYFTQLVGALLPVLHEGGALFVGDVRSACLLEAFHASVQLYKAEDDQATADLLTRTWQRVEAEQEMSINPCYFLWLKDHFPRISHVEILPKRGNGLNEMTRFRYDVLIHLDGSPPDVPDVDWQDWEQHQYNAAEIAGLLRAKRPPFFAIRNIRNGRVQQSERALALMGSHRAYANKAALMSEVGRPDIAHVDPEDLWSISQDLPYQVQLSVARSGENGGMDALFIRAENEARPPVFSMPGPAEIRPEIHCANNPLQEKLAQRIVPQLREHMREKVPVYMVPADFVLLSRMPVTPAGKIDRSLLPEHEGAGGSRAGDYRAPRTSAERGLADIWTLVLDVEAPDIGANFFDLGGHSLKATQVASRIHKEFGVEIALRELFNLPTIEELAGYLESLETAAYDGIATAEPAAHYPLSHAQRRLWILAQIEETSSAYNMPASLILAGPLDREAFGRAFEELAQRHESLRTRFVVVDDEPRQMIDAQLHLRPEDVDLTLEKDPDAQAQALARSHAQEPFDLACGPLVRISILKLAEGRHVLLFNMHHIIADDWSMGVFVREIGMLYDALRRGVSSDLPELRVQYKDYAAWQNERLASGHHERGRAFWLSRFAESGEVLDLPTDEPRPAVKTYRGESVTHVLDTETAARLRTFNQEHGASMFMTLITCVNTLLYRYTGQQDITIGLSTAGRAHAELEDLIGFFINTLPFRMRVDSDSTLQELLSQAADELTACLDQQMYPVDRLIDELQLRRDVSRSPLYDVTVTLQNVAPYELLLPEITLSPFVEDYDMSKFDLSFNFQEVAAGLRLDITYNSDLFLRQRVERMTRHFEHVVKGLLHDSKQTIAQLDILPTAEREQLLAWRNPPVVLAGAPESLTAQFERQATRTPEHTALVQGADSQRQQLTYRELNERANQLARCLRGQGVQIGDLVGLYMDRSIEVVVSILGILKAGAAYVPLDPMYPRKRVAFMIRDAAIRQIVTRGGQAEALDLDGAVKVIDLDRDAASIRESSSADLASGAQARDPAYVIYTSGSTGQPKGVVVTHANVTRLFRSTESWFSFDDTDTWTLFHSYAFDFSVWEIWGALLHGGRLVVVPQHVSRSPAEFLELLEDEDVTVLNQTPSAFQQLIDANVESPHDLALRYVIFGGEALDYERLRPWFECYGDTSPVLVNMYGITETTVHVTYRPIRLADLDRRRSLIGRALPDLQLYIVDPAGQPAPVGVAGEIWIGGDGVAQGYLRREQLTAEKFTADPFRAEGEGRVYHTGDRARFLPDGDVEYLGRIDSQVQIRGFRVELGEIETRLATHPLVKEAVVVADRQGADSRLIAYCLGADKGHPAASDLRRFLAGNLPEYMMPTHFVCLDAFPLTVNGKLDRRSLPTPEDQEESTDTYVAADNATERAIAATFAKVLGVDRVSREANFFDLGAHSMSIVSVHRHLQQEHGMELSIVSFYEFPTVVSLATHISGAASGEATVVGREATDRAARRRSARQRRRG